MNRVLAVFLLFISSFLNIPAFAEVSEKVIDIPTRQGVTQRFLYLAADNPKAAVILFPGGHGGLQISSDGTMAWGKKNFLVRSRDLFVQKGLTVAVVDAPSDRQSSAFTGGFRQKPEHVKDMKSVIAWLKKQNNVPVWLVGTSRGTQSAAFIATQLSVKDGGPDGLVLTSTILSDDKERPVTDMQLGNIAIPVLVVHHEQDGCKHCSCSDLPGLMKKLGATPRHELITFKGGKDKGYPCEAFAYHGFNGIENEVVSRIAEWIK